ncbi:MAG: DUF4190 domain-containing protein [Micropruina sp.]|nr:DUF4190 domain-containing protein [Micropruina sp.]
MSNQQYSPWAGGDGSGEPAPQPSASPADQRPPTLGLPGDPPAYTNPVLGEPRPAEPSGWSEPQTFDALQPAPPAAPVQFGRRVPYGYAAPPPPEHPNATLVLILGIVGLFTNFVFMPFISPIAWYLGAKARREMAARPGAYSDSGKLTAGFVLGIIGSLIALLVVSSFVLLIIIAVNAPR